MNEHKDIPGVDAVDVEGEPNTMFDKTAIEADILEGVKAYRELHDKRKDDWHRWSTVIIAWRGLRTIAFEDSKTSDVKAHAYKMAIRALLKKRRYQAFTEINQQTRHAMYQIMDHLDDVNDWYEHQEPDNQMRWKHPMTILKHCPIVMRAGGLGHNKPPKLKKPQRSTAAELEKKVAHLTALLLRAIDLLLGVKPDAARELLRAMSAAPVSPDAPDEDESGVDPDLNDPVEL